MQVTTQVLKVPGLMLLLCLLSWSEVQAQFTAQWLDIGSYHSTYVESGARHEISNTPGGMEWPAIMRESSHMRARAFWIGTKDWTSPEGQNFPYYVMRIGPRGSGSGQTFPIQNRIISKYEDTIVNVDGAFSFDNVAIVDEVDPNLPADRMIHNIHNTIVGVTVDRKIYAYANAFHDNYHIIEYTYTNTGNTDEDDEIELPNQTLKDVHFFRIHRWRGIGQEAWTTGNAQAWGKFSMIDVVGDGHADYPVDFTAVYLWPGFNPDFTQYNNLGGPLWDDSSDRVADGDSVGRLSGGSFTGRVIIHADNSTTDRSYDPAQQPHTIGFMDQDEVLTSDGSSHQDYYELGILTRENPGLGLGTSSRMIPHYADRIEPGGQFWNPTNDASSGKQGGHAATVSYGPYDMAPGESIRVVVAEGIAGLSIDARIQIGRAYKRARGDNNLRIEYDANGDGTIDQTPFDYSTAQNGSEALTKNQWVMTARDSFFVMSQRAIDLYAASNSMANYPVPEPPPAPLEFNVTGRPNKVEITWTPNPGGPSVTGWELWRTSRFEDNVYDTQLVTTLPASATSFDDVDVNRGTDYYYFLQAVGAPQSADPTAVNGTPSGVPLKSSRYLTQAYQPVNLKRPPGASISDARVVPNPVNLGSAAGVGRFTQEDRIAFFNIPGESTISIYTELGELVKVIEHTDGSGDELVNLTTDSRQLFVSGIYIAVIEDTNSKEKSFLKFVVIR